MLQTPVLQNSALHIAGVSARLGDREVLRALSMTARAGTLTAICGANGAGKSTLLRAILGEIPFAGEITLNGLDTRMAPPARMARLRAVLAQETQVAFAFTVQDIVTMGLEAGDFGANPDLTAAALHAVGLADHAGRPFHKLSGGERQRTHLARALAQVWEPASPLGPRWLFLDEPVASLDLGHQLMVLGLARSFADAGGGVVAVMHDLNLSAMFADRIAFLVDGRIAACGAPGDVLQPALLERAYFCRVAMNTAPAQGPWLLPQACALPRASEPRNQR